MNTIDPYIIVGAGRCGTSTVARILHKNIGICMGETFVPADENNPLGYYEDVDFVELNHSFIIEGLGMQQWNASARRVIAERQAKNRLWGFKSIRVADILGLYLGFFDSPKLIWCYRNIDAVIASYKRCYNCTFNNAVAIYGTRTSIISRLLKGRDYLFLDFTNRLGEDYIEEQVRNKWSL